MLSPSMGSNPEVMERITAFLRSESGHCTTILIEVSKASDLALNLVALDSMLPLRNFLFPPKLSDSSHPGIKELPNIFKPPSTAKPASHPPVRAIFLMEGFSPFLLGTSSVCLWVSSRVIMESFHSLPLGLKPI